MVERIPADSVYAAIKRLHGNEPAAKGLVVEHERTGNPGEFAEALKRRFANIVDVEKDAKPETEQKSATKNPERGDVKVPDNDGKLDIKL